MKHEVEAQGRSSGKGKAMFEPSILVKLVLASFEAVGRYAATRQEPPGFGVNGLRTIRQVELRWQEATHEK